jgi:hypothetical protein
MIVGAAGAGFLRSGIRAAIGEAVDEAVGLPISWVRGKFGRPRIAKPIGTALPPNGATPLGNWGEGRLRKFLGLAEDVKKAKFWTSDGWRTFDAPIIDRIAHESKAGVNVKLTAPIRRQILKDKWLIENGDIAGAHWHFWQGADQGLLDFLTENGIDFTVH